MKLTLTLLFHFCFSLFLAFQTTSNNIQAIMESRIEKRTKGVFVPAGGKHLVCFLDDLNMPAHDLFGSQPPLELLRLWIDYGFWYDLQKQTLKFVKVRQDIRDQGGSEVCTCKMLSLFHTVVYNIKILSFSALLVLHPLLSQDLVFFNMGVKNWF